MPAPTPPKITSPSMMLTSGTRPPIGVNESCQPLIAPQLAAVVIDGEERRVRDAEPRPPCLPCCRPAPARVTVWSAPAAVSSGLPRASAQ